MTLKLLYGKAILVTVELDELLYEIADRNTKNYIRKEKPTWDDHDFFQSLEYLSDEGYVKEISGLHSITQKGKLKLAMGGFLAESKKAHLSVFAFWISFVAFVISVVSFFS